MARDSSGPKNEPQYANSGTPADGADLTELGAYAAKVGNRRAETTTVRTGLTGADVWPGLEVRDLTDGHLYEYFTGPGMVDRDTATPYLQPAAAAAAIFVDKTGVDTTIYSGSFTPSAGDRVLIVFTATGQSTATNAAGNVWVTLNGTQLGQKLRVQNLGVANAPLPVTWPVKGFAPASSNALVVHASTDTASGAGIYYNSVMITVWSD